MLLKLDTKKQIILLILALLMVFALDHFLGFKPGVRISWYNLLVGILCSLFAFIIFNLSNLIFLLFRGNRISFKISNIEFDKLELITNSVFIATIEELTLRAVLFGFIINYNSMLAYLIGGISAYLLHFKKSEKLATISYAVFGVFCCFIYDLHRSYFLNFISSSIFWIFWLSYLNSGYFISNYTQVLNIRRALISKTKK